VEKKRQKCSRIRWRKEGSRGMGKPRCIKLLVQCREKERERDEMKLICW